MTVPRLSLVLILYLFSSKNRKLVPGKWNQGGLRGTPSLDAVMLWAGEPPQFPTAHWQLRLRNSISSWSTAKFLDLFTKRKIGESNTMINDRTYLETNMKQWMHPIPRLRPIPSSATLTQQHPAIIFLLFHPTSLPPSFQFTPFLCSSNQQQNNKVNNICQAVPRRDH